MTVLDSYDKFMAKYIRRTITENDPVDTKDKVDPMLEPDEWGQELEKFEPEVDGKKLNSVLCRKMALSSPLFCKGVWKKSMDTFRAGAKIHKNGKQPSAKENAWINQFNKRNNIFSFLRDMKICNHIYGFAPVYIRFYEDLASKRKVRHYSKPKEGYEPFKLALLDPEKVKKFVYKNDYWKRRGVKHLLYKTSSGKDVYIHPDRVQLVSEKKLPFSMFGISDVAVLRHIINSNADIDIAVGKILSWASHGIREWRKEGANTTEKKHMKSIMETFPDVITSDMDYELKVHSPEVIDPKSFYDYTTMAIAAVLVMPTHILTGVRVGRVTGAEAGYSDYNKDISDVQELVYSPFLAKLYQMIFTSNNLPNRKFIFNYDIEWNPTYVNEMAEAELLLKRAEAVEKLLGKDHEPLIDMKEAREILKRGAIEFEDQGGSKSAITATKDINEVMHNFDDLNLKKKQIEALKKKKESEDGRS